MDICITQPIFILDRVWVYGNSSFKIVNALYFPLNSFIMRVAVFFLWEA